MTDHVEIRKIIVGVSKPDNLRNDFSWFWNWWRESQARYPTNVISMDSEEVSATLYNVYRIAGYIECPDPVPFSDKPDLELYPGFKAEDRWKQLPAKIMIGDGIMFMLFISLEFQRDRNGDYLVQRVCAQEELLDFHVEIPVCVGLRVESDVADAKWFF